jgi:hypothetical protein
MNYKNLKGSVLLTLPLLALFSCTGPVKSVRTAQQLNPVSVLQPGHNASAAPGTLISGAVLSSNTRLSDTTFMHSRQAPITNSVQRKAGELKLHINPLNAIRLPQIFAVLHRPALRHTNTCARQRSESEAALNFGLVVLAVGLLFWLLVYLIPTLVVTFTYLALFFISAGLVLVIFGLRG